MRARRHAWLLALPVAVALGCAGPRTSQQRASDCQGRARQKYDVCLRPVWVPKGQARDVTRGDASLACRDAYHQALSRCAPGPEIPLPTIGTSTSS